MTSMPNFENAICTASPRFIFSEPLAEMELPPPARLAFSLAVTAFADTFCSFILPIKAALAATMRLLSAAAGDVPPVSVMVLEDLQPASTRQASSAKHRFLRGSCMGRDLLR